MEATPKILHFIESGGLYGAERVILNLSREMQRAGKYIPVVGCIVSHRDEQSDLYDAALAQGTEAVKLVIPNIQLPWALPLAARKLKRLGVTLVHSHGYKPSVYAHFIRLLTGIKVIATCHLWFEPQNAPLKTRVMMGLEKRFYRSFDKVVAVSDPIRKVLLDFGIEADRAEVVENGVDMTVPRVSDDKLLALREEFDLQADEYCLFNAARLTRQKSQATLIQMASHLKEAGVRFRLLIVGQGPLERELRESIRTHSLEREVILAGFRSDIPDLLSLSDLFLLPSLDEGMPMSLLEAVAAKVPVVSTAVGDIPKLIRHNESGLIVQTESPEELSASVIRLLNNPDEAQTLTSSAHTLMAARYSQEAMGEHYHRIYQSMLESGRNGV